MASDVRGELLQLQQAIDQVDEQIIRLLNHRFDLSRKVGDLKLNAGMAPFDAGRVAQQRDSFVSKATVMGLDAAMSRRIIVTIVDQVLAERATAHQSFNG